MTVIKQDDVIQSVADALQYISYYHPTDFIQAMHEAYLREASPAARDSIAQILINSRMCATGHRPICQDTGIVTVIAKVGMDVRWDGATMSLDDMINEGVRRAYTHPDNVLRASIEDAEPRLEQLRADDEARQEALREAETKLNDWQQRWEAFNREQGSVHQTTQVERARIEQLENQLRRLAQQADRLAVEREALVAQESSALLSQLAEKESLARSTADELSQALNLALDRSQKLRAAQFDSESRLEAARGERGPAAVLLGGADVQQADAPADACGRLRPRGGGGERRLSRERGVAGDRRGDVGDLPPGRGRAHEPNGEQAALGGR